MAQARFLDQVPIGVFQSNPNNGGGTIDIYQNGTLVSSSVPYVNISGSASVLGFAPFGENDGPIAAHKFEVIFKEGRGVPEVR